MAIVDPQKEFQQMNAAPQQKPITQPIPDKAPVTRTRQHVVGFSFLETITYAGLVVMIAILLLFVLSLKSNSFDMQSEKTSVENAIYVKQGEITELQTEINSLASYERIYDKADELGLSLNNSNIRVVEKNE